MNETQALATVSVVRVGGNEGSVAINYAVTTGTATSLNFGNLKVAAKTGTAQIGLAKDHLNSWVIGFAPFTEPRFAFTVLLEDGPKDIGISAQMVMSQLLVFMIENTPEYFN